MNHVPIKMGPLALLMAVISVCMTTLGILTFATAEADLRLAQKYKATVIDQYEREVAAQEFVCEADAAVKEGGSILSVPGVDIGAGTAWKTIEGGRARLTVGLREDEDGGCRVVCWRTEPIWEAENNNGGLWIPGG